LNNLFQCVCVRVWCVVCVCVCSLSVLFIVISHVAGSMQLRGKKYILVVKCNALQGWEYHSLQAAFQGQVENGIKTGVCHVGSFFLFYVYLDQYSFLQLN